MKAKSFAMRSLAVWMSLLVVVSGWIPFGPALQLAYAISGDVNYATAVKIDLAGQSIHSAVALPGGKTGYLYSDAGHTYYRILNKDKAQVSFTTLDSQMGADAGSPDAMKVIYASSTGDTLIAWEKEGSGNYFIVLDSTMNVKTTATAIDDAGAAKKTTETTPVELSDGNIAFMWFVADDSAYYMSIMGPDGSAVAGKTNISDNRDPGEGAPSTYRIATNHNGTFMVVSRHYQSAAPTVGYAYDRAVVYNNNGTVNASLFNLNAADNTGSSGLPLDVIGLSDHHYAALFMDGDDLTIQEFDDNGLAAGSLLHPEYDEIADFMAGLLESASGHFLFYRLDANCLLDAAEIANDGNSTPAFNPVLDNNNGEFVYGGQIVFSGFEDHIGVFNEVTPSFTLHGVASAVESSTISPTTATFDKNTADTSAGHYQDVTTTVTFNDNTLSSILNGVTPLIYGTDYTLTGSTVAIKTSYLAGQPDGLVTLTFNFNAGAAQTLAIMVSDTTPTPSNSTISPTMATFDKNTADTSAGHYADVTTTVTFNGNTLSSILNGVTPLIDGTDYMLSGSTVTISKSYLAAQSPGIITLTFTFNAGSTQMLMIAVGDTSVLAPAAPTVQLGTTASGRANLTWAAVAGATSYTIFKSTTSGSYGAALDTVTGATYSYTAQGLTNGTPYYFIVKSVGLGGDSVASNEITVVTTNPSVPAAPPAGSGTPSGAQVLVNGKPQDAGTLTNDKKGDQTVTTVALDPNKLDEKLAVEGQHAVVTIPVNTKADIVVGELDGQMVKNMEQKQAVVEIKTDHATYTLPAQQINISAVSDQLGTNVSLQEIKVHIEIAKPAENTLRIVRNSAAQNNLTLVADPLDFNISGTYGGQTVDISTFNAYVERTIALPDDADPQQMTTGVVIDPDGSVRHVPTKITKDDNGKYVAKINSLTNSTYSVVWHPVEFKDVASHWAKEAVNDMGSRLVIGGVGHDLFNPDQAVTRAEFAAIVVRGLGLKLEAGASPFSDVHATDWYNAAVQTAYAHQLISGFEDGAFRPMDSITREQAMTMIARAMHLTGMSSAPVSPDLLNGYQDADTAASWAISGIAECLQAGIVSGRSSTELAPTAFISRAEAAALVQRLLRQSDLI